MNLMHKSKITFRERESFYELTYGKLKKKKKNSFLRINIWEVKKKSCFLLLEVRLLLESLSKRAVRFLIKRDNCVNEN